MIPDVVWRAIQDGSSNQGDIASGFRVPHFWHGDFNATNPRIRIKLLLGSSCSNAFDKQFSLAPAWLESEDYRSPLGGYWRLLASFGREYIGSW